MTTKIYTLTDDLAIRYNGGMNRVITIPQRIARRGELVVIPKKDYEKLLRFSGVGVAPKKS